VKQLTKNSVRDRKQAEEYLRRFEFIAAHSRDIVLFMRRDNGRLIEVNAAAENAYGYSREELLALSIHDLRAAETQALIVDQMAEADVHGILLETIHRRKDGSIFPVEVSSQGTTVGGVRMLVSVIRDITDRKHFEEVLRQSEKKYRKIFESAIEGIYQTTIEGRYLNVNPSFARMFGFSSPQEVIDSVTDISRQLFVYPQTHERMVRMLFEHDKIEGFEAEVYRKDKSKFWISINTHTVRNKAGEILFFEGTNLDITARKLAEEALRKSESLLRTIADNSPDPIFMTDRSGRYIMANPATLAAIGKPAEEVIGKTEEEFSDDSEMGRALDENNRRIMESGQTEVYEETINDRRGRRIYLSTKTPYFDQNGKVIGLIDISRDITERKRMEEALQRSKDELEIKVQERTRQLSEANIVIRQSEEKYRELVESARSIILRMDYEGNITFFNEFAEKFFGYSRQEILGRNVVGTIVPETESSGRYLKTLLQDIARNPEKYTNNENENIRKNGERVWIAWTNAPVRDDQGKLLEVLSVGNDITERKKMEERLRSAQSKLRAMASEIVFADERSRQHFATDLHDTVVQTMGAAKLRSQLIQEKIPPEAQQIFAELQEMLSQSITQTRMIMAEMSPPVLYELGFVPALEWLTEKMEKQYDIVMNFEKTASGSQPLVHEIQVLLFQATRELLMNVVKHAKSECAAVRFSDNGHRVRIEVTDNGIGFDKKQAFRTDISGGGFGLFSIRERLRHFGGELKILSKPGEGTRVVMTAPRVIEK